jgi:diacylglycerol kinase (ATP)
MGNSKPFTRILIIFNPNSTGDAPAIAKETAQSLQSHYKKEQILLSPTKHAGHATTIAEQAARLYSRPLIISVSGDGGYHEVINGVRSAIDSGKAKDPVVTVIGAGNANDHYRVVHKKRTISEIIDNEPQPIDLIKVIVSPQDGSRPKQYYAHSYVGIGLTPRIAEELNRNKLNPIKEVKIILQALFSIRPTKIEHGGKKYSVDSLIFANISQMAKVLTLTDNNSLHDGKFELIDIKHTNIFGLLLTLLRAATVGLKRQPKSDNYSFALLEDHPLQIDGEIIQCKKNDSVTVSSAKNAVTSLL